ncbi:MULTISPECIES: universal stress protein [Mangrovimonas]|uniref:universal stress protein n=1 Tax=Mangrovimonas TaxID=1211036 RepID=UPI0006B5C4E7|nr:MULTISPECIES: universal stress protein [Mangrovimonas]OMP31496.1 universal stress protein [Mangrovimonas sp. DI 80]
MKNILLPTDFSENSWNAIKYALQLFEHETCKFYLLNTYTPPIYQIEYALMIPDKLGMVDTARSNSVEQLNDFKDRMHKEFRNPKHTIETMAIFNTLIQEIILFVKEKAIDYVVMGTKGASGTKGVLFGSNTVQVFKNVKCPVLAIPENFPFETPHEVLFPTDYSIDYKESQLKPIRDILSAHSSRVNILNVVPENGLSEWQEKNKDTLETYFKDIAHIFHSVSNATVVNAIEKFQIKAKINLLVMINNKHSFFENLFFKSNINQIGFNLKIPFLLIPSKLLKA